MTLLLRWEHLDLIHLAWTSLKKRNYFIFQKNNTNIKAEHSSQEKVIDSQRKIQHLNLTFSLKLTLHLNDLRMVSIGISG